MLQYFGIAIKTGEDVDTVRAQTCSDVLVDCVEEIVLVEIALLGE
jgi:hypothetical protein